FSGIALIFKDGLQDLMNPDYIMGILFLFIAISGWSLGSIFTKKLNLHEQNISLNLCYQFAFAGIVQCIFGFFLSEKIEIETWSLKSILATVYLAAVGSVAAYFAFHYALK